MLNPGLYPTSNDLGSAPGRRNMAEKNARGGERMEESSKKESSQKNKCEREQQRKSTGLMENSLRRCREKN